MHDDTLDRTTNMSGLLRDHDFSELAAECNCAANFTRPRGVDLLPDEPQPDGRVPICTLEEVVQWAKEKNVKMLFDVKDSDTKLVDKIEEVFEQYDLFDCALVCSFYPWVIYRIKRQNNRILTGVTWRRRSIKIFLPQFVGADMVLIERGEIYGNFVEDMHNRGLRVCAWTVNDTNEMIWMAQKLKIPFLTDRPLNARHLLDAADGVNNAELALN
uniref:GP-PDE domain-containing protein n=1 Tax=Globodera pallida TaxID=36090 RepID=A0A183BQW5_GLOPA